MDRTCVGRSSLLALLCWTTPSFAEAVFDAPSYSYPTGASPRALLVDDLTGDGLLDVVVSSAVAPCALTVFIAGPDRTLNHTSILPSVCSVAVISGDVDKDGVLDLVSAGSAGVRLYLGMGGGLFQAPLALDAGPCPQDVSLADMNGDGALDLIVANYTAGCGGSDPDSITLRLNRGDGSFLPRRSYLTTEGVFDLTVADLDRDGTPDVVASGVGGSVVTLHMGKPDGTLYPPLLNPTGPSPLCLGIGYLDNDPWLDLVTGNHNDHSLSVHRGGAAYFTLLQTLPAQATQFTIDMADVDGDGDDDVAVGDSYQVQVYRSNGDGRLAPAVGYDVPTSPLPVVLADMTGDERPDLVTVGSEGSLLTIVRGGEGGVFGQGTDIADISGSRAVICRDLNSDGHVDLASANGAARTVSIALNRGQGAFHDPDPIAVALEPTAIVAGDWNGDERLDLAVMDAANGVAAILLATGDGAYSPLAPFAVGTGMLRMQTARFNDDDYADLLFTAWSRVVTAIGNGDGTFETSVEHVTEQGSGFAGDVNGDGRDDLVLSDFALCTCRGPYYECCDYVGPWIRVRLAVGDGTFGPIVESPADNNFHVMATGDLDGDGVLDLVGGHSGGAASMRGLGDGRFDSEMFIPARRPLHNLELHDMDHDGALDIVAQFTGEVVGICHGDGARGFLLPKPFLWSTRHLGGPTVGDMDSDGWLDIVAPTRLGGIALMRNVGDVPTGVLLDLADASVMGTTVRLRWYATLGNAVSGSVGRRQGSVEEVVGEATRNGEGHLVFIDEDVLPGKYRYQLHYLDGNGVSRSTRTVDVEVGGLETVISSISPNPMMAGGAVATVRWGGIEPTVLECFDVQGRRRFRKAMTGPSGSAEIRIDPGVEWAPGVYVLRLSQGMRQVRRNLVYLR